MALPLSRTMFGVLLAAHSAPSLASEQFMKGGNLKLDWNDCGDSSYHAKVKSLVPNVLSIGKKTTVTGSGDVDEQVTAGAFTITAKFGVTEHYSGDVCAPKVFHLPLGVGSITWDGLKCPVAKGTVSVGVDVSLSSLIPAKLAKGTIEIKASGGSKENLICVDIKTSAENTQESNPIVPIVSPSLVLEPFLKGGNLKLDWEDCGDTSYHAKVKSLVPNVLSIGTKTTVTGSGDVDEQVTAGAFTITAKFGVTEHYSGDVCSPKVFHLPLGVGSITWDGLKCPVAKGTVSVGVDVSLSSLIPAKLAKGTIEIKASGASKENLICVDIKTSAESIRESNPIARIAPPSLVLEPFVKGGNLKLDWTDCGDSSYHAKVKSLVPNVLSIGTKTTVTGSGDVDEQVTAGAFTITAKFGVTEHYSGDVCSPKVFHLPLGVGSITWDGLKCPVAKGTVSVGVDVSLSSLIPAKLAKGTIEIKASGATKENLICLDIKTSAEQVVVV